MPARPPRRRAELGKTIAALRSPELAAAEAALTKLRGKLMALPRPSGGKPSPTNGYHSGITRTAAVRKWVQVDLGQSLPLDAIRLIPARPTDFPDTPGFGFPARFRVEVSDDPTFVRAQTVADHTRADWPNPGDKPVVLFPAAKKARFVRVTADKLWLRSRDYCFALAELQVESGGRNVAPGKRVTALDSIEGGRWSKRHLVDNFDSRRQLPDISDAKMAALLRTQRPGGADTPGGAATPPPSGQAHRPGHAGGSESRGGGSAGHRRQAACHPCGTAGVRGGAATTATDSRADPRRGRKARDARRSGALSCVAGLDAVFQLPQVNNEGARRRALADWLADPKNVLTWR